jgi:uncharacterized protein (DUF1501 family)
LTHRSALVYAVHRRSHGAPGNKTIVDGWLNRYLTIAGGGEPIAGVSLSNATAKSLAGAAPSLAFESIAGFSLTGNWATERRAALDVRYGMLGGTLLGNNVLDAFEALDLVATVNTASSVIYPNGSELGAALKDSAALIKSNIGVRVIAISIGGWDHWRFACRKSASSAPLFTPPTVLTDATRSGRTPAT